VRIVSLKPDEDLVVVFEFQVPDNWREKYLKFSRVFLLRAELPEKISEQSQISLSVRQLSFSETIPTKLKEKP